MTGIGEPLREPPGLLGQATGTPRPGRLNGNRNGLDADFEKTDDFELHLAGFRKSEACCSARDLAGPNTAVEILANEVLLPAGSLEHSAPALSQDPVAQLRTDWREAASPFASPQTSVLSLPPQGTTLGQARSARSESLPNGCFQSRRTIERSDRDVRLVHSEKTEPEPALPAGPASQAAAKLRLTSQSAENPPSGIEAPDTPMPMKAATSVAPPRPSEQALLFPGPAASFLSGSAPSPGQQADGEYAAVRPSETGRSSSHKPNLPQNGSPRARGLAGPNGDWASEADAPASLKIAAIDHQTHFAPVTRAASQRGIGTGPVSTTFERGNVRAPISSIENAPPGGKEDAFGACASQKENRVQAGPLTEPGRGKDVDVAPARRVKSVPADETSASPKAASFAAQIARAIGAPARPGRTEFGDVPARSPAALNAEGPGNETRSMSSVQTLRLQLDPETLGKVTVRMRLSGTRLDLEVEADELETVRLIGKDKGLLSGKLRSAGYALDGLVIKLADAPQAKPAARLMPDSQDQLTSQANGGSSGHDRHPARDRNHFPPDPADSPPDGAHVKSPGELFI